MDDAIETLQTCLRLLDLVHRIDEMVREGKYWGALRVRLYLGFDKYVLKTSILVT